MQLMMYRSIVSHSRKYPNICSTLRTSRTKSMFILPRCCHGYVFSSKHQTRERSNSTVQYDNDLLLKTRPCQPYLFTAGKFHVDISKWRDIGEENKSLTIWKNVKEIRSSPVPALVLGASGVLPFAAAPMYLIASGLYSTDIVFAQIVYGAAILSFLGGVRWGFTLENQSGVQPNWFNMSYSVTPSLVAWAGVLMPQTLGLLTLIGGLGGTMYMDMVLPGYPSWFKGLRFLLSFCAILSLWTTFTCKFLLKTTAPSATPTEVVSEESE